jgi:hypothetical protein
VGATEIAARNLTELAAGILADLATNPPKSLTEARLKLTDLVAALRGSIEEQMVKTKTQNAPDYQAAIGDVQVRMEAVAAVLEAITSLEKAEASASEALARTFKKLHAPRTEARVWKKLAPAPAATTTPTETIS